MKPVFLVGKGPSSRPVDLPDDYCVVALNGALRMCARADYLFVNDVSALEEVGMLDLIQKVEVVVLPTFLHLTTNGKLTEDARDYQSIFRRKQVLVHQLETAPEEQEGVPKYGRQHSVAETAVACMLHLGYRDFRTVGIDVEGRYHDVFVDCRQARHKGPSWYKMNWTRICKRIQRHEGTLTRYVPEDYDRPVGGMVRDGFKPEVVRFKSLVGGLN